MKGTIVVIVVVVVVVAAVAGFVYYKDYYSPKPKGNGSSISGPAYGVTFTETGLPSNVNWFLNISGQNSSSSDTPSISVQEHNGTYSYIIATANKSFRPSPNAGKFVVNGASVAESVTILLVTYSVKFSETGLPSGAKWFVNLTNGQGFSSTTSSVSFSEPNGSYAYTISTSYGEYSPSPSSGSFTVNGNSYSNSIKFTPVQQAVGVISAADADKATNQLWYESLNGTVGITNVTTFYDTLSYVVSPGTPIPFPFNQSGMVNLNYANFVSFVSTSRSSLSFGYAVYNSFNLASITNSSLMQNFSNSSTYPNHTSGSISGAFYFYTYTFSNGNYSAFLYSIYVNTIMMGYYFGQVNMTASQFSHIVYDQVQILNSYRQVISVKDIVSIGAVDSYLGSSWNQDFIGSFETHNINVSSNYAVQVLFRNNTEYQKLFSTYESFDQFAFAGFSSENNGTLGVGYGFSSNSTAVSDAYQNFTAVLSQASSTFTPVTLNDTYNGMTYSAFVGTVIGNYTTNSTFTVSILFGMKGGYLTGIICYSLGPDTNALISVLESESNLL